MYSASWSAKKWPNNETPTVGQQAIAIAMRLRMTAATLIGVCDLAVMVGVPLIRFLDRLLRRRAPFAEHVAAVEDAAGQQERREREAGAEQEDITQPGPFRLVELPDRRRHFQNLFPRDRMLGVGF